MTNEPRSWFRPKRVGIGWTPQTWQGWMVALATVGVITGVSLLITQLVRS